MNFIKCNIGRRTTNETRKKGRKINRNIVLKRGKRFSNNKNLHRNDNRIGFASTCFRYINISFSLSRNQERELLDFVNSVYLQTCICCSFSKRKKIHLWTGKNWNLLMQNRFAYIYNGKRISTLRVHLQRITDRTYTKSNPMLPETCFSFSFIEIKIIITKWGKKAKLKNQTQNVFTHSGFSILFFSLLLLS